MTDVVINGRFTDQRGIATRGEITGHNGVGIPCRKYTWIIPMLPELTGKTFEAFDDQIGGEKGFKIVIDECEIREIQNKLSKMVGFISDFGFNEDFNAEEVAFADGFVKALSWMVEDLNLDYYKKFHLNIPNLEKSVGLVEERSDMKLEDYRE